MKKFIIVAVMLLSVVTCFGQDDKTETKNWDKGVTTSLNFSQVAFSNWAAGGVNSISFNGFVKAFANYNKDKSHWLNNIDLEYGLIRTSDIDYLKKSNDKIYLESKYGYDLAKKWRLTATFNFLSQLTNGYDYTILDDNGNFKLLSGFMSPGYIQFGVGFDYLPVDYFTINLSPLMSRLTVVTIPELRTKYGNVADQVVRFGLGAQVGFDFNKEIFKNVTLQTSAKAFFDYLDKQGYNPVVNWDLAIVMQINKFMAANIGTSLIWDKNVLVLDTDGDGVYDKSALQFKELLGVGFTFSF